jgi:hypothetical protein
MSQRAIDRRVKRAVRRTQDGADLKGGGDQSRRHVRQTGAINDGSHGFIRRVRLANEMTKACDEDDQQCTEDEIEQVASEDVPHRRRARVREIEGYEECGSYPDHHARDPGKTP